MQFDQDFKSEKGREFRPSKIPRLEVALSEFYQQSRLLIHERAENSPNTSDVHVLMAVKDRKGGIG
ncbi:hypothetical protein O3Q51_06310 [Cryomorphaceae bacterium 1068]|nr:hypothetical protein [Cryomorphaceae bacterium 1068]